MGLGSSIGLVVASSVLVKLDGSQMGIVLAMIIGT